MTIIVPHVIIMTMLHTCARFADKATKMVNKVSRAQ